MPTCGFIRVQPDGMKIKDAVNRQRYDAVFKRTIATYPERHPMSDVRLLSISSPVLVNASFKSEFTVSFKGHIGCLVHGNDIRCVIYDDTGTLVVATDAIITNNGVTTIILTGQVAAGRSGYYASIQYGPNTYNSEPSQDVIPLLPRITNISATVSSLALNEVESGWFYDNSFFWSGTITISFVSHVESNISPSYRISNITDPTQEYYLTPNTVVHNVSYGLNTITLSPVTIITIPANNIIPSENIERTELPYSPTERLRVTMTYNGITYTSGDISVTPALIENVTLTSSLPYWSGADLYVNSTVDYGWTDQTSSGFRYEQSLGLGIGYTLGPLGDGFTRRRLYEISSDGSIRRIGNRVSELENPSQFTTRVPDGQYSYYATVEYDLPSFSGDVAVFTTNTISIRRPELTSPPGLSFSNIRPGSGVIAADVTVAFDYQPSNTPQTSSELTLKTIPTGNTGEEPIIAATRTVNVVVGSNTVLLENVSVIPNTTYTVSIRTGSVVSTSVPVTCPDYLPFRFTSVPSTIDVTFPSGLPVSTFSIVIGWTNTILGYTGGQIKLETVGLSADGIANDSFIIATPAAAGPTTYTFNVNLTEARAGNVIEQNLWNWVDYAWGFSAFRFRITDIGTGISILSTEITSD